MNILLYIAWKNIWRNRLRSLVIMSATSIGIFGGLLLVSFAKGMTEQRVSSALHTEVSHLQIHLPDFIGRNDFNLLIPHADSIEKILSLDNRFTGISPRILLYSIVSSAETGTSVKISGIDPNKEKKVSDLFTKITEGTYFETEKPNQALISSKLAEKLKVKLNSKIVLQIQDTSGNISPAAFRVSGIFRTDNSTWDEFNLFVNRKDLLKPCGLEWSSAHELALCLKDYSLSASIRDEMVRRWPSMEILTWKELDVILSYMSDTMDQYLYFIMVVILLALVFGIVNTMMMAILERIKELGMLMAIGMSRTRIMRMILYETILLTLTGALAGIVISLVVIRYYGHHGIDLSIYGKGMLQYGLAPRVYLTIGTTYVAIVVILVMLTGLLASVFPVLKAVRLRPVEALKTDN